MNIFNVLTLLGGLAMFLYGMRLMGDALKESSSGTLKKVMEKVTDNPVKAFILGVAVTALIQSSTATIVITSGLVGAGILSLHQALGIIIGANVGTTVTGQVIRLLDLDASGASWLQFFKPSTLAPIALIVGIVLIMGARMQKKRAIGNIAMGFGILFSGLLNMTGAVNSLAESGIVEEIFTGLGNNPVLGYLAGAGIAFTLQSSSATIGILQAFSSSGLLVFKAIYSVIVGIYLGDCVTTAIVCSIGARSEAKRVGIVNILFNLSETVLVLVVVTIVHKLGFLESLWNSPVNSGIIANTNTIFNLGCAVALFPLLNTYEKLSRKIVKDDADKPDPFREKVGALSPAFFSTPALALGSCYDLLLMMFRTARENIRRSWGLIDNYDPNVWLEIQDTEEGIDRATDSVSKYIVEILPRLKEKQHVAIVTQYHKVATEFERLGDQAVNISKMAQNLSEQGTEFTPTAMKELDVLIALLEEILSNAELSFERRNLEAAYRIEALEPVVEDVIDVLKNNHLRRMSLGECTVYADAAFMNLLVDMKRIADVCSNIGIATIIRVRPELADREHHYFEALHGGDDEAFNKNYQQAHDAYFSQLRGTPEAEEKQGADEAPQA
ncbi:MAG: Na/Pi cotransporter family protein [Lachnospiraceae bacterium]|nr:Na/Pi cotransporter family protein [Lachnospiraceae bacterium]